MLSGLSRTILKDKREYFIHKVKEPLMKSVILLGNRYPEPTAELGQEGTISHPNLLVWLRVWDKFLSMEDNSGRSAFFDALKRIWIGEGHDPYYEDRKQVILELWLEEVLKGNWKPRPVGYPQDCWRNDYRGIGYEFLVKCYKGGNNGTRET